ncbi:lipase member M [Raphidocelis subcapitata]|uniref:Lipase member M n=1 Tax=Raphidocelis subcapitata TaxID=307507 RepID=A0A2V0P637_9CHLO|nr:lipase member M [Raphidocelis subcapitata]|eukprot:GBF94392.1 lipase member M [Raphidocelis subcapitata]
MTVASGPPPGSGSQRPSLAKALYAVLSYALLVHILLGLLRPPQRQAPMALRPRSGAPGALTAEGGADDLFAPMAELVLPHGYPLEEHFVTTADGFVLRVFRIAHGAANRSIAAGAAPRAPRPVALLQHALMDSSAGWVLLGRRALAFQLVDAGFDVWLTNSRGNRYSRNHTRLDPDADPAFWEWTWADKADFDLPAVAEHVEAVTGQRRLVLMGYSQGSMMGLAALSSQPDFATRVSLAVLFVPVAYTRHISSWPFVALARAGLDRAAIAIGWREWGTYSPGYVARAQRVCGWLPVLCELYLTSVCGANPNGNLAPETLLRLMGHLPVGTSVRNMAHWSQAIRRRGEGGLLRYDHGTDCSGGRDCNRRAYGADRPPAFNLTAITTPLALFTGDRDALSPPADVALLTASLAPGVLVAHHAHPDYAHLDFLVGADAPQAAYPAAVRLAARAAASGSAAQRGACQRVSGGSKCGSGAAAAAA